MELIFLFVLISFSIPVLSYTFYGCILSYFYSQHNYKIPEGHENYKPKVSVVLPAFNEETIIGKKIENILATEYPGDKLTIVIVEDSSTDKTYSVLKSYSRLFPNLKIIHKERREGYSNAMLNGLNHADGEIIIITDAGVFHDEKTIPNLVRHFVSPEIGGVTGKPVLLDDRSTGAKLEWNYIKFFDFLQIGETHMDSVFHFRGEASAVRKEYLPKLDISRGSFDTLMGLSIREKGYRTIFDPEAKFYEYAPKTFSDRTKQKVIRATNLIGSLLAHKHMMLRAKYNRYGLIILPAHFMMLIATPVFLAAGFLFLIALLFVDTFFALEIFSVLGLLILLLSIISRNAALMFFQSQYALLIGVFKNIFGIQAKLWQPIASTRKNSGNNQNGNT